MTARRLLSTVAVALAALAVPAEASLAPIASTRFTAHHSYRSTGLAIAVHAADPTTPGTTPKVLRRLSVRLPTGSRFTLVTAGASCHLSDRQLQTPFGPTCPRRSRVGTVHAVVDASPLQASVRESGGIYVTGPRTLLIVLYPALPGAPVEVIRGSATGPWLALALPHVVWGKLITVVPISWRAEVPALAGVSGPLLVAGRCVDHHFAVVQQLRYADGSQLQVSGGSGCSG